MTTPSTQTQWTVQLRTSEWTQHSGFGPSFEEALKDARRGVKKCLGYIVSVNGRYLCHGRFRGWTALRDHVWGYGRNPQGESWPVTFAG